jgi:hypothetical protein
MGKHPRLGQGSPFSSLEPGFLQLICLGWLPTSPKRPPILPE